MTRKVFLVLLAVVLTLSVGLVACGGPGQEEEEEEEEEHVGEQEEEEEERYELTIASTGGGLVRTPGEGTFSYDEGTDVDLVAEAEEGYQFVSWTGDVATIVDINAAATSITVDGDYSITANFEEEAVTFTDPNLEAAVREAIGKPEGSIYPLDLGGVTNFTAYAKNLHDLTGLEYCTNLTFLDLGNNQIIDISPLANLTSLEWLHLNDNQISDISPLANLASLDYLYLGGNQISDIEPLFNNTGLSEGDILDLVGNPLSYTSINTYVPQLEARGVVVQLLG